MEMTDMIMILRMLKTWWLIEPCRHPVGDDHEGMRFGHQFDVLASHER
jgi:hypothetical protein